MPLVTSVTTIERFAGAMFGLQIGSVTLAQVQTDVGQGGITGLNAVLNSYYTSTVGNSTTVQIAASILTNLGIVTGQFGLTAAQVQGASDYIVANLNGVPASARGAQLAIILNSFSNMNTDATYGAVATAFNTNTANAVIWSQAGQDDKLIGAPGVFNLTTAVTTTVGTAGNDVFVANVSDNANTFQSGDVIVGGAGKDMLYATLGNSSAFAITASTSSVEQAVFRSQANNTNGSNGGHNVDATGQKNTVDAERMVGVNEYWNTDSRADLKIEDIRILNPQITKDITIVMRNTDPGSLGNSAPTINASGLDVGNANTADFEVYFSPESLRAANSVSTQAITVFVASQLQQGNALPGASYDATKPLANLPYDTLNVTANGIGYTLKLDLLAASTAGGHTGLGNLTEADFLFALKAAVLSASNGLATVSVNTGAYNYSSTDGVTRSVNTYTITAPTFALGVPATNVWNASAGLPPTNAFAASAVQGTPVVTSPLVTSTIILDNVGREDEAGSLTIGGMDTRIGVERFEIKVASNDNNANNEHTSGSWISRAQSTNNVLKEVQITNVVASDNYHEAGIIDNRQVDSDATANARTLADIKSNVVSPTGALVTAGNSDSLSIGTGTAQAGNNLNELRAFPALLNADGLRDVRLFDASTFKGDIKLGAYFDSAMVPKYQNLVDTAANDKADNVAFVYTLGSGNDSLNVTIDPTAYEAANQVASERHDFAFNFNGGDGNDQIQVQIRGVDQYGQLYDGQNAAWVYNQSLDKNITIDGGNGNDVIRKPGAGNANLIGGAGDDTIYAENTGGSNRNSTSNVSNDGRSNPAGVTGGFTGSTSTSAVGNSAVAAFITLGTAPVTVNTYTTKVFDGVNTITTVASYDTAQTYATVHTTPATGVAAAGGGTATLTTLNDSLANASDDGIVGNDGFAKFVFNTATDLIVTGARPLDSLRSAAPVSVNAVNGTVKIDFLGFDKTVNIGTSVGSTSNTAITDLTINQAVKDAINNDSVLNKLLIAQDGPGHTLIISSLVDGYMGTNAANELRITLGNSATTSGQTGNTSLVQFDATQFVKFGASSTGVYTSVFASTQNATVLHNGADSVAVSDNVITPGTGNDVIVLGTAGFMVDQSLAAYTDAYHATNAQYLGSNDRVVYSGFDNGNDTIVYFDSTVTTKGTPVSYTSVAATTEKVTLTFTDAIVTAAGQQTITFAGINVALSGAAGTQGVIPAADVAYQFGHNATAFPGWTVSSSVLGSNTVTLTHTGAITDLTTASFTGTYTGTVTPVTTQQGADAGVVGQVGKFDVNFTIATSAASATDSFTFDGAIVAYAKGDGATVLAAKANAATYANWTTTVDATTTTGAVTVHFFEKAASVLGTTAHSNAAAVDFDVNTSGTMNNVFGSINSITTEILQTGAITTTAAVAAGAQGEGFDYLDFSAYRVANVVIATGAPASLAYTTVTGVAAAAAFDYIQLVESTVNVGVYTVTQMRSADAVLGGDTLIGTVGTIDLGHHQNFVAANFII